MSCFCGRPAGSNGLCIYHDPQCVRDPSCRRLLSFTPDCERCYLPGGEVSGVLPRLREARIHGPLIIETVTGDVDLEGARGVDLYIYSVRGDVRLAGARFRHIYIDRVLGVVDFSGGRADSFVALSVDGGIRAKGAEVRGRLHLVDSSGFLDAEGASAVGEVLVDKFKGTLSLGVRAYSLELVRISGAVSLAGASAEGDIYVVESTGDRLDLSGVEVGGRLFLLASKFGGVRIDKPELLKKIVVL